MSTTQSVIGNIEAKFFIRQSIKRLEQRLGAGIGYEA
jgi:hypothetical protein